MIEMPPDDLADVKTFMDDHDLPAWDTAHDKIARALERFGYVVVKAERNARWRVVLFQAHDFTENCNELAQKFVVILLENDIIAEALAVEITETMAVLTFQSSSGELNKGVWFRFPRDSFGTERYEYRSGEADEQFAR